MNEELLDTLRRLQTDQAAVIQLYEQLYHGNFIAVILSPQKDEAVADLFLTYDTADGVRELPIFTQREFLEQVPAEAQVVERRGNGFWEALNAIVEKNGVQVAVDPGQRHGIRLTAPMILGMIAMYGRKDAASGG